MSTDCVEAKEEKKQQMMSAVGALSSIPSQPVSITNVESDNKVSSTTDFATPVFNKATASRSKDRRLPAVKSTSVFDRLYKSHTVASKSHTLASHARLKPSIRAKLPNVSDVSIDAELLNFDKMAISRSKRVSTPHKIQLQSRGGKSFSSPSSFLTPHQKKKRPSTAPHTAPTKTSGASPFGATPRSAKRVYEFSPRMKPLTKLYFVSKFHPGAGLEPIEPISLGYTFFQTFCEYETGGIDAEQIAKEIFIAFFKKDHNRSIRHWKLDEPILIQKSSSSTKGRRGGTIYSVTMNATYAWGNAYRVTHAKGFVRFKGAQNKEIWVENFTYDVAGDP